MVRFKSGIHLGVFPSGNCGIPKKESEGAERAVCTFPWLLVHPSSLSDVLQVQEPCLFIFESLAQSLCLEHSGAIRLCDGCEGEMLHGETANNADTEAVGAVDRSGGSKRRAMCKCD